MLRGGGDDGDSAVWMTSEILRFAQDDSVFVWIPRNFIGVRGVEAQDTAITRTWGAAVLPYTFGDR